MGTHLLCLLLLKIIKVKGNEVTGMERKNQDKKYVSHYEIGGTEYEIETSFSGSESLNNKIIRLMLGENFSSKQADNFKNTQYNINKHSVLSGEDEKEEY